MPDETAGARRLRAQAAGSYARRRSARALRLLYLRHLAPGGLAPGACSAAEAGFASAAFATAAPPAAFPCPWASLRDYLLFTCADRVCVHTVGN